METSDIDFASVRRIVDQAQSCLRPVKEAEIFPAEAYVSERFWEFEKQAIFAREWLCLAHVNEIRNPGDYLPLSVIDEPVIIAGADQQSFVDFAIQALIEPRTEHAEIADIAAAGAISLELFLAYGGNCDGRRRHGRRHAAFDVADPGRRYRYGGQRPSAGLARRQGDRLGRHLANAPGMPGLQTLHPSMLVLVDGGALSLSDVARGRAPSGRRRASGFILARAPSSRAPTPTLSFSIRRSRP